MAKGGARPGAGRKKGGRENQKAIDVALQVLNSIDQVKMWQDLLQCDDVKVRADIAKYLTNRVHGMPRQTVEGNADSPIVIRVEYASDS